VATAKYTSVTKEQCLPSTRYDTQSTILRLLSRHESRFVRLQGSPGTGKTAIAKSIAHHLDRQKLLAASFFWDKTGSREGANSIERFPSTLAYQLASFSPEYERLLVNHLLHPSSRDIHMLPLEEQMASLVIAPMSGVSQMYSSTYPVVVLDGLDECGDRDTLEKLMDLVLLLDKLPRQVCHRMLR
jgi:uridine kinase